jgi:hypothetical protein
LCLRDVAGFRSRVLSHRDQTFFEKLNYKFTLNLAIDYALCCSAFL